MQNPFLARLGFDEDPFASTNAAGERRLDAYFVDPPYFDSVVGDPRQPSSHIVLAPRGGGKTAQKRRLESIAPHSGFFCISYDEFDLPSGFALRDADWNYHVTQICRRMTAGILALLHDDPSRVQTLTKRQKDLLAQYADWFLGPMSAADFLTALRSIKSISPRIKRVIDQYGGPVALFVRAVLARLDINEPPSGQGLASGATLSQSLRYHLDHLSEIIRSLDFFCTYVLVDRVDELEPTSNDAEKTFAFVRPLLTDLRTLETPGLAFKFFLWDETLPYIQESVRTDRLHTDVLSWSPPELERMLSRRLAAHSDRRITSIAQVACDDATCAWDFIIAQLAHGSPRDMIVLLHRVIAEQTRTSPAGHCIEVESFWSAVRSFSDGMAADRAGKHLPDLRRIGASGRVTFGSAEIANEVFRISQRVTANKLQSWQRAGVIAHIGTLPNPGRRPPYLYAPADLRMAIAMAPNTPPEETLEFNAFICHGCQQLVITDRSLPCPSCMAEIEIEYEEATSVMSSAVQRWETATASDRSATSDIRLNVGKIVHIASARDWREANVTGELAPWILRIEGAVPCSIASEVEDVANRLFRGTGNVLLLVIDPARLTSPLLYERGDDGLPENPRIRGPVNLDAIVKVVALRERRQGFVLPVSQDLV